MEKEKRQTVDETCELLEKELEESGAATEGINESIKVGTPWKHHPPHVPATRNIIFNK